MIWKLSKVLPIERDEQQCCICYDNTTKFDKCAICNEGIVCSSCSKKMKNTKCPICGNIEFKPIEIITEQKPQELIVKKRRCKSKEPLQICLGSLLCLGVPFSIGVLICHLLNGNVSQMMKRMNPLMFFFIGFLLIFATIFICCIFILIWNEILKKYKIKSSSK